MEAAKPNFFRNILVKLIMFSVFLICFRFAYVVTIRGESCDIGDFCFFPSSFHETISLVTSSSAITTSSSSVRGNGNSNLWTTRSWRQVVQFYTSIFQDLIADGNLSPGSKSLCTETLTGQEVFALREIGVLDSIGVARKTAKPLVVSYGANYTYPFGDSVFDFVFCGEIDKVKSVAKLAVEVTRVVKPEGVLVVHTNSNDTYSLNSFIGLFDSFSFVKSREIDGLSYAREIVMRREVGKRRSIVGTVDDGWEEFVNDGNSNKRCGSVPGYKRVLVDEAEPLIEVEPLKPWITLKRNIQKIKYLPSMVDISFKRRYVYVDVGARSYGSSIGSWFRKQYPKQNKTFEVYAIEADKSFYEEYKVKEKNGVHLLPYAAWVRNETLHFEINHGPGEDGEEAKGKKGMGRIKPVGSDGGKLVSRVEEIQGFDLAEWLKRTVSEKDYVVMKMDVEGTEFDLIPRLVESGAICLVDEVFLECHYNRWQRCCPGERSGKYEKTYGECLDLFRELRENGVLVHQWF